VDNGHVLPRCDEVEGAEVGDGVAFEAAGVVEVELLEALAGREPGSPDAAFPAVGLPSCYITTMICSHLAGAGRLRAEAWKENAE
jgi:hypothetical protein